MAMCTSSEHVGRESGIAFVLLDCCIMKQLSCHFRSWGAEEILIVANSKLRLLLAS